MCMGGVWGSCAAGCRAERLASDAEGGLEYRGCDVCGRICVIYRPCAQCGDVDPLVGCEVAWRWPEPKDGGQRADAREAHLPRPAASSVDICPS